MKKAAPPPGENYMTPPIISIGFSPSQINNTINYLMNIIIGIVMKGDLLQLSVKEMSTVLSFHSFRTQEEIIFPEELIKILLDGDVEKFIKGVMKNSKKC